MADMAAPNDEGVQTTLQTAPIQQPDITPVANPTPIRFVEPGLSDAGSQNLMNLARSLSTFDAGLSDYFDARQKQSDEYDKIQAEADFHKNNAQGYQQAVAEGHIPAYASQAYVNAYKNAEGGVAGFDLQQKFDQAYQNWGGKNSDDPNAYSGFVKDFLSQNIASNDPEVLKGLMPHINQMVSNGQAQYIQDRHTATVNGSVDAHVAQGDQTLTGMRNQALKDGQVYNLDAGFETLMGIRQNYLNSGGTAAQIDNKLIDTITSQAIQARGAGGHEILSLLDRNVPGTNYTFAQTPYGQAQKEQTLNTLDSIGRRAVADAKAQTDAANKSELSTYQSLALQQLASDPRTPVPESIIQAASKDGLDPEFRLHVTQWQDAILKSQGVSDPQDILALHWAIEQGAGPQAIADALNNGKIHTAAELDDANKLLKQQAAQADVMRPIMQSPPYKALMATAAARTMDKAPLVPGGMSDEGLAVQYAIHNQMEVWLTQHPNATSQQAYDALQVIGKANLDTIQATPLGQATVTPLPGSAPNPFLPQQQQQPQMPQPQTPAPASAPANPVQPSPYGNLAPMPQAPQPSAQPQGATQSQPQADPAAVKAWYASLTPPQQQSLARVAQQTGKSIDEVSALSYQQQVAAGKVQPQAAPLAQPASSATPPAGPAVPDIATSLNQALHNWKESDPNSPQIVHQLQTSFLAALHNQGSYQGNYTLAAIKDNPKAAHILDFISGPESGGNYNAYFEHAKSTADLSKLTLNQIMAWQQERVNAGAASSATGRYQFMHSTLQELKNEMHLTGNEKFTPEFQDQLAIGLLKGRGYDKWVAGKMSDADFANNLAEEWASLPNLHTGRSRYSGDGLNHALVTPKQVLNTLAGARSLPGETAQNGDDEE